MHETDVDRYQEWTETTAMGYATSNTDDVSREMALVYLVLALNGEAGEVAEKAKRVLRGDGRVEDIEDEVGDVMWYLARICAELDYPMSEMLGDNIEKLSDRDARNVIAGSGDDR